MNRVALLRTLVLAVAIPGLAACGSDAPAAEPEADLVVRGLDGVKWDKDAYTATAGDVVIALVNDSSLPHDLHLVDAGTNTELQASLVANSRGQTVTKTVKLDAGTYTIICKVPGHGNMKAALTVS